MLKTLSLSEFSELCNNGSLSLAKYEFNADDQCGESRSIQHTFRISFDNIEIKQHSRVIRLFGDAAEIELLYVLCVRVCNMPATDGQQRTRLRILCENCLHPEDVVEYVVVATKTCEKK